MVCYRHGAVIVVAAIISASAWAQQKISLTIDEAVRIGLENSKGLHASFMRVTYADAKSAETEAGRLPSVRFLGSYTRLSDVPPAQFANPVAGVIPSAPQFITLSPTVDNNYNLRLSLQQPIFTGLRLSAASSAAENTMQAASEDYAGDKADQIYNVKNAYWSLFKAMEFKKVIDENVEQIKAHLQDVRSLMDQGMATTNDLLKVQVQLSDAQLRQIDAANTVRIAMVGLDNTIGLPLSTEVEVKSSVAHQAKEFPSLDVLIEQAMERRPDLKAMQYRVKATEDAVTAARGGWWPQIYLLGNYYYQRPNQRLFPTQDLFKDTWDVSLSVSLDIWNWGTTVHQTDQAQAQLAQTKDALGQMQDGVSLEITQTYLNLKQAKERIAVAAQGVEEAEENYRVTRTRFNEGLALNSDLLDAEVALLQAKTNYTQTVVDHELAEARLEKAVGGAQTR